MLQDIKQKVVEIEGIPHTFKDGARVFHPLRRFGSITRITNRFLFVQYEDNTQSDDIAFTWDNCEELTIVGQDSWLSGGGPFLDGRLEASYRDHKQAQEEAKALKAPWILAAQMLLQLLSACNIVAWYPNMFRSNSAGWSSDALWAALPNAAIFVLLGLGFFSLKKSQHVRHKRAQLQGASSRAAAASEFFAQLHSELLLHVH